MQIGPLDDSGIGFDPSEMVSTSTQAESDMLQVEGEANSRLLSIPRYLSPWAESTLRRIPSTKSIGLHKCTETGAILD